MCCEWVCREWRRDDGVCGRAAGTGREACRRGGGESAPPELELRGDDGVLLLAVWDGEGGACGSWELACT